MKTCIQALGILAVSASLTFAQEAPKKPERKRPNPQEIFKKLDTDNSGTISLAEFKASPRGQKNDAKAEEIFNKIDADSNGEISRAEFKAHRPKHGGKGGERRRKQDGGGGAAGE
jgi:hypothetical protein